METAQDKAVRLFKENPVKALSFCKKWRNLGKFKSEIIRGFECIANPSFYASIGFNPTQCTEDAIKHLQAHLGL